MITLRDLPKPGVYARLWKRAYAVADAGGTVKLDRAGDDLDSEGIRRAMRKALDRRINARAGLSEQGRNFDSMQQVRFRRDQRAIQDKLTRRVCVYQFETRVVRERFAHLLSGREDF